LRRLKPYPLDRDCPCESGKTYRNCCKRKAFKFQLAENGDVIRTEKIAPQLRRVLLQQKKEFKEKFGRNPRKKDPVFYQQLTTPPEEFDDTFKDAALAAGIEPAKVYAALKLGFIPIEDRLDHFSDVELREWMEAVTEYEESLETGVDLLDDGADQPMPNQGAFVELIRLIADGPLMLASVLDAGVKQKLEPPAFYQMLFSSQALYFLKRFCSAMRLDDFDGALYLCRAIYEAVIRIRFLRFNPAGEEIFLALSAVGKGSFEYRRSGDKVTWSVIEDLKNKKSIRVDISNRQMVGASRKKIDLDVYSVLFRHLSSFVHPNVDSIHRNFSLSEGFSIHFNDNPFEGALICASMMVLLFSELGQMSCLRKEQRRDARVFARKIAVAIFRTESERVTIFPGDFECLKEKLHDAIEEIAA
jgi:hypothetical protein